MKTLWQDIRYGIRMLVKNPTVTILAVIALAIGIGANSALFTIIYNVILSPLPFQKPHELMVLQCRARGGEMGISGPDFLDLKEQSQTFAELCMLDMKAQFNLTDSGEPISLRGFRVTTNFYDVLGVKPSLGRGFIKEESISGNNQVVILGHDIWESRFGADPNIIGTDIFLDGEPFTVIGITPTNHGFIERLAQVIVPIPEDELAHEYRGYQVYVALGRLQPGLTMQTSQAEMNTLMSRLGQEYRDTNTGKTVELVPIHEIIVRDIKLAFMVLYSAVCFVLLIACVDVANLLLAKSGSRVREVAIRLALGATRLQIMRQILIESVLLSLIGGGMGLLLAYWGLDIIISLLPIGVPLVELIAVNIPVLGFTFLLSITVGLLFGLVPAWSTSNSNVREMLGRDGRGRSTGVSSTRILNFLAISEITLAVVLLIGAGLLIQSFLRLQNIPTGFDSNGLFSITLELPKQSSYKENYQRVAYFNRIITELRTLPGVESVVGSSHHPMSSGAGNGFIIEGQQLSPGVRHAAEFRQITPNYFEALRIPLVKGRYPTELDGRMGGLVALVNESFVNRFFHDKDPIGRRIEINKGQFQEIIGVVGNVRASSDELNVAPFPPKIYEPINQFCRHSMTVLIKSKGDLGILANVVRQRIRNVDPGMPVDEIQIASEAIRQSTSIHCFCSGLLSALAAVALLLAMIGVYGVMAYSVSQRTQEIGIRKALGAPSCEIAKSVVFKGFVLTITGILFGLVIALGLGRLIASLLYQTSTAEPLIFFSVPLLLFGTALLACYIPARRAAKIDPMEALRYE